jgi:hypothetical protein
VDQDAALNRGFERGPDPEPVQAIDDDLDAPLSVSDPFQQRLDPVSGLY